MVGRKSFPTINVVRSPFSPLRPSRAPLVDSIGSVWISILPGSRMRSGFWMSVTSPIGAGVEMRDTRLAKRLTPCHLATRHPSVVRYLMEMWSKVIAPLGSLTSLVVAVMIQR